MAIRLYTYYDSFYNIYTKKSGKDTDYILMSIPPYANGYIHNFHLWRSLDVDWRLQFWQGDNPNELIGLEYRDTLKEVKQVPLKDWMKRFFIYLIFGNTKKVDEMIIKYKIDYDQTKIE